MQGQQQVVAQPGQPQPPQPQQQQLVQQGNVVVKMNDVQVQPLSSVGKCPSSHVRPQAKWRIKSISAPRMQLTPPMASACIVDKRRGARRGIIDLRIWRKFSTGQAAASVTL